MNPAIPTPRPGGAPGRGRVGARRLDDLRSKLPKHQLALLQWIAALHYSTTRQLERLHFQPISTTPVAAARNTRRCLSQLTETGLITHLDRQIGGVRAGSAAYIWRTTEAGARLIDDPNHRRTTEPSTAHLDHVLDVAELVVRLHEHARGRDHLDILQIQTEPACWRPFTGTDQEPVWLKPDLRVTLGDTDRELHWFVEVDRSTEHRSAIGRKAARYIAAWHDGREQARTGVFPRVLWVVPDQPRAKALRDTLTSISGADNLFAVAALPAAVDVLTDRGAP